MNKNPLSIVKSSITKAHIKAVTIIGDLPLIQIVEFMRQAEVSVSIFDDAPTHIGLNDYTDAGFRTPFAASRGKNIENELRNATKAALSSVEALKDVPSPYFTRTLVGNHGVTRFIATSTMWGTVTGRLAKHPWLEMRQLADHIQTTVSSERPVPIGDDVWHCPFVWAEDLDAIFEITYRELIALDKSFDYLSECAFSNLVRLSVVRTMRGPCGNHSTKFSTDVGECIREYHRVMADDSLYNYDVLTHALLPDTIDDKGNWRNPSLHGNTPGMCQYKYVVAHDAWRYRAVKSPAEALKDECFDPLSAASNVVQLRVASAGDTA